MDFSSFLAQPALARVLALLNGDGEETRVVGGAVRNLLLGRPASDIDLATTALPEVVTERAEKAGFRALPTGIAHGTVTLLAEGAGFEVTTLREDIETDGRRAVVRFGRDFSADAMRRDFTMNALSLSRDGLLHDTVGGVADIGARRVRFIGDPATRIAEDHLRSLRFFRFHAAFGEGPLDPAGLAAVIGARAGLLLLSRERVRAELLKLMSAPGVAPVAQAMADAGLLTLLTHLVPLPARLKQTALLECDPLLRLAALFVLKVEDAERLRAALALSNAEHRRLEAAGAALESLHGGDGPPNAHGLRTLLFLRGREAARDGLILEQARRPGPLWRAALETVALAAMPRLPFSGADLISRGAGPGPQMGRILKILQAAWIRAGFPQEPGEIARLLDAALAAK